MPLFNEIQEGRFNNLLRKLLNIKSGTAPAAQVSSEIMPVLSPFRTGVECAFLEGWDYFNYGLSEAVSAGNTSAVQIRNPPLSPAPPGGGRVSVVVVVVERFSVSCGQGADVLSLYRNVTANMADSVATGYGMDTRGRARSTAVCSGGHTPAGFTPAAGKLLGSWNVGLNQVLELLSPDQEYVILPGDGLLCNSGAFANSQLLAGSIRWRERVMSESELTDLSA